jgi:hypothetical protein
MQMPNGKLGDHPLTDILIHKRNTYGQEADSLIRKIAEMCSNRELQEWWHREIGWEGDGLLAASKAHKYYDELLQRAKDSGLPK